MTAHDDFAARQRQTRTRRWLSAALAGAGLLTNLILDWPYTLATATATTVGLLLWDRRHGSIASWWRTDTGLTRLAPICASVERHGWDHPAAAHQPAHLRVHRSQRRVRRRNTRPGHQQQDTRRTPHHRRCQRDADRRSCSANGLAWITAPPFDIGDPANIFDGDPATLYRSASVNPALIQVTFAAPVTYTGFRALFSNAFGDPAYRWKVDVADTQADMDCRCGSFAEVVPFTETVSDRLSAVVLNNPVSARIVRLTANRLTGDDFVHINEWQIIGQNPFAVLNAPRGVAVSRTGDAFVAESASDQIVRFAAEGVRVGVLGGPGSAPGQLRQPWDVAVDQCGNVTVADRGNDRVQVFDPGGTVELVFGGSGNSLGRLNRPAGITIQPGSRDVPARTCATQRPPATGNRAWLIYVADTENHRVQRFLADGSVDRRWGANGVVGTTGVVKRDHTGFDRPTDVAVNPVNGHVYVADFGNARLEVFDQQGRYLRTYLAVYRPNSLAFDPAGNLYIAGEDPNDSYTAYDGRLRLLAAGDELISRHYTGGLDDISRIEGGVAVRPDASIIFTDVLHGRVVETDRSFAPPLSDLRIKDAGTAVTFRWRTKLPGTGSVRYGDTAGVNEVATDPQVGTEHEVTVTGLPAQTRLYYAVSFTDPFDGSPRFTPVDIINTGVPPGQTPFLRLKAVGVIYTDVDGGPGYQRMDPTSLAEARTRFQRTADFYWRNSGFRLWLDITVVEIDRDVTWPLDIFSTIEADLAAHGYSAASDLDAASGPSPGA